jgi:hypothetical protein
MDRICGPEVEMPDSKPVSPPRSGATLRRFVIGFAVVEALILGYPILATINR